jgi:hypothetical protein
MLFVYITILGIFLVGISWAFAQPLRTKCLRAGVICLIGGMVMTYWWNPRDLFTTNGSMQKRAEYTAEYKKCVETLELHTQLTQREMTMGLRYGILTTCEKSSRAKTGYQGEQKSVTAPFTR